MGAATSIIFVVTKVCRDKHVFVATKHTFCHDKHVFVTTSLLSQQKCACYDKIFVVTNIFLTNICCDEHNFVKHVFVVTHISHDNTLLGQKYVCHDKRFVMASILLSRQKTCFVMTNTFVATKMILVTAPATNSHNFLL